MPADLAAVPAFITCSIILSTLITSPILPWILRLLPVKLHNLLHGLGRKIWHEGHFHVINIYSSRHFLTVLSSDQSRATITIFLSVFYQPYPYNWFPRTLGMRPQNAGTPPDTLGWVKFQLQPGPWLLIRIPRINRNCIPVSTDSRRSSLDYLDQTLQEYSSLQNRLPRNDSKFFVVLLRPGIAHALPNIVELKVGLIGLLLTRFYKR